MPHSIELRVMFQRSRMLWIPRPSKLHDSENLPNPSRPHRFGKAQNLVSTEDGGFASAQEGGPLPNLNSTQFAVPENARRVEECAKSVTIFHVLERYVNPHCPMSVSMSKPHLLFDNSESNVPTLAVLELILNVTNPSMLSTTLKHDMYLYIHHVLYRKMKKRHSTHSNIGASCKTTHNCNIE